MVDWDVGTLTRDLIDENWAKYNTARPDNIELRTEDNSGNTRKHINRGNEYILISESSQREHEYADMGRNSRRAAASCYIEVSTPDSRSRREEMFDELERIFSEHSHRDFRDHNETPGGWDVLNWESTVLDDEAFNYWVAEFTVRYEQKTELISTVVDDGVSREVQFTSTSDWDNATSENLVYHESVTNTDHDNSDIVNFGYSYDSPINNTDLQLFLPLDEDSSGTVYDVSDNSHNGTNNGATVNTDGIFGTSGYEFDGSNDDVTISDNTIFDVGTNDFAVSVWIKTSTSVPDRGDEHDEVVAMKADSDSGWAVYFDNGDNGQISGFLETGSGIDSVTSSTDVRDGNWHNIIFQNNGGTLELHIDGSQEDTQSTSASATADNDLILGDESPSNGSFVYEGFIDNFMFYDNSLSSTNISNIGDPLNQNIEIVTSKKSFASEVKPDLKEGIYTHSNGSIDLEVTGTPDGSGTETNTLTMDGFVAESISWANYHTDFEIKLSFSPTSNFDKNAQSVDSITLIG